MIILDTNVISELAKPRAAPSVVAWADAEPLEALYTTAISEAEMLHGVKLMAVGRRRDDLQRAVLAAFASLFAGRILPFDSSAAGEYAEWAAGWRWHGMRIRMADLQIAAIARARGATAIATGNTRDFADCGVKLIDPWLMG